MRLRSRESNPRHATPSLLVTTPSRWPSSFRPTVLGGFRTTRSQKTLRKYPLVLAGIWSTVLLRSSMNIAVFSDTNKIWKKSSALKMPRKIYTVFPYFISFFKKKPYENVFENYYKFWQRFWKKKSYGFSILYKVFIRKREEKGGKVGVCIRQ